MNLIGEQNFSPSRCFIGPKTVPFFLQDEMSRASFHFPLHRYLAAFICQGVKTMGMSLNDILPSADLLPKLMMHPLRVQVGGHLK